MLRSCSPLSEVRDTLSEVVDRVEREPRGERQGVVYSPA